MFSEDSYDRSCFRFKDKEHGSLFNLQITIWKDHLSFILQCPPYRYLETQMKTISALIFAEINANRFKYLEYEKKMKITVIRFVVEYVRSNCRTNGLIYPNALHELTNSNSNGWLISMKESVACFGRVDIVVECNFFTKLNHQYKKTFTIWVDSFSTIADLRDALLTSGNFDVNEFNAGDFFKIQENGGENEVFGENVKIADIIHELTYKPDISCLVAPDDSILM